MLTAYIVCSPIICSLVTAVQHSVSDLILGPPHSERAFLLVKPSVNAGDLKEAEETKPVRPRDGHGIPKCNLCPSVVFFIPPDLSIRFCVLF